MRLFTFVAATMGECCTNPHLYISTIADENEDDAWKEFIREIEESGLEPHEIVRVWYGPDVGGIEEDEVQFGEIHSLHFEEIG